MFRRLLKKLAERFPFLARWLPGKNAAQVAPTSTTQAASVAVAQTPEISTSAAPAREAAASVTLALIESKPIKTKKKFKRVDISKIEETFNPLTELAKTYTTLRLVQDYLLQSKHFTAKQHAKKLQILKENLVKFNRAEKNSEVDNLIKCIQEHIDRFTPSHKKDEHKQPISLNKFESVDISEIKETFKPLAQRANMYAALKKVQVYLLESERFTPEQHAEQLKILKENLEAFNVVYQDSKVDSLIKCIREHIDRFAPSTNKESRNKPTTSSAHAHSLAAYLGHPALYAMSNDREKSRKGKKIVVDPTPEPTSICNLPNEVLLNIRKQILTLPINDQVHSFSVLSQTCKLFAHFFQPLLPHYITTVPTDKRDSTLKKARKKINSVIASLNSNVQQHNSIIALRKYLANNDIHPTEHQGKLELIIGLLKRYANQGLVDEVQKNYIWNLIDWVEAYKASFTEDYINLLLQERQESTPSSKFNPEQQPLSRFKIQQRRFLFAKQELENPDLSPYKRARYEALSNKLKQELRRGGK